MTERRNELSAASPFSALEQLQARQIASLEAENERLRTLIEQAAAEANHGELTDGTLALMVEVAESD